MAHQVEPMDIDSDFDNKENSLHHNNVLPFTEKGYEELDVSELNMKLRYSVTPASSPMSKSYTANCLDNRSIESGDDTLNVTINENSNLTRSLNSNLTKNDSVVKCSKTLPLQTISTEQFVDSNRNTSVLRPLDSTVTQDNANVTVTVSGPSDIDDHLLSSSSSAVQTPEATTPTKEIPKNDGGSPIMRGLKSVLNMFRSSQSPIPPADSDDVVKPDILSPVEASVTSEEAKANAMLVSTPISAHRKKEASPTKRSSPTKEPIVFNEDLEKELQWKDETTIIFSQERIPIHKLFFPLGQPETQKPTSSQEVPTPQKTQDLDSTVEYMDISYNDSIRDRTMTDIQELANKTDGTIGVESDGEFVDCETTFTKSDSILEDNDKTPVNKTQDLAEDIENISENTSSRLKQVVLNTTQDILDATLSITPEDLLPECLVKSQQLPERVSQSTNATSNFPNEPKLEESIEMNDTKILEDTLHNISTFEEENPNINDTMALLNQTVDVQDPNLTKTFDIKPNLDQTVDIIKPAECTEDPNLTKVLENVTVETLSIVKQEHPLNETLKDKKMIAEEAEEFERPPVDVENNSSHVTDLNTTDTMSPQDTEIHTSNITIITDSSPEIFNEVDKLSQTFEVEEKSVPVKEASMTEFAAEVPLPDEDDLEKEPIPDIANEAPNSLPLDLVDDIKVQMEKLEATENVIEDVATQVEENENIDDKISDATLTSCDVDNLKEDAALFESLVHEAVPEVVEAINVESKQVNKVDPVDLLPEPVTDNTISTEAEKIVDQVHNDVEMNTDTVTEPLNTTVEFATEEKQGNTSMNINQSVIELKPLPDIINQMPNVENLVMETIPEPVILEQPTVLPENNVNVFKEEVVSNDGPELLTKTDVSDVEEPDNVLEPEMVVVVDEVNKVSVTDSIETTIIEDTHTASNIDSSADHNNLDVITAEPLKLGDQVQPVEKVDAPISENTETKTEDDEIILSENNSPFVSVIAENIPEEIKAEETVDVSNINEQLATTTRVVFTPPASPPIASKGYNFNFDEIDDPFATKTKIRMSPSFETPVKTVEPASTKSADKIIPKKEINNSRKSQPERKRPATPKKKFNSTFSGDVNDKTAEKIEISGDGDFKLDSPPDVALEPNNVMIEEDKITEEIRTVHENPLNVTEEVNVVAETSSSVQTDDLKITSSSELSTYFSADTSSSESFPSRNVFNIPEIDDMNFNPFATKSKMRQSPPLSFDGNVENPFATKSKIKNTPESSMILLDNEIVKEENNVITEFPTEKIDIELMEKDASGNLSNVTASSKATDDKNGTVREVNTDDDDTVEGPFLEAEADDKMSDFDGENIDMMHFNELPTQGNEENVDNGELFIDAEAFEFLLNQNKSNTVVDSGKESLFLKFDPLFAKRMSSITSDGLVASLNKIQKRQSTPTKAAMPVKEERSPIAGPSNLNITQDMDVSEEFNDDLNVTVSKPMMVVPPAVNPVTPRNKSLTPNRSNRRSITFTSPAMAVIDRLLSLSGNTSLMHDTSVTQHTREQNEADLALTQLRELLAEKEIHVYSLRSESKELKDRLSSLESHLKSLEEESQDRLKKINDLNARLAEKTKINKGMAAVVEEYERTIASLISETAQDKKRHAEERIKLINERDEQTAHLASMEVSFSDLHSKYEKSKQVILNCKANEDTYKKSIKAFEENLTKMQNNYELLKQHATSKLNHANQELEKMNKAHEAEVLKLNAMIKRKELHITSLEESLAQKTKANEELTAICDELINKVG
ncbi:mucin-17-like [Spodoptera litura]|uniref:Mucin-17-like n=1 Tax=Spodoptera litura TaxID=69820 RepID=A0A9J7DS79_SPOLT|nr:mucin-17-like [Spodoptera litura]